MTEAKHQDGLIGRDPQAIERMFSEISPRYDLLNRILSFGLDGSWRGTAVRFARPSQARRVIDLASGTGDLALAFAGADGFAGEVLGIDFSGAMIERARAKAMARKLDGRVRFLEGDALATGEPDGAFDIVSIGFGLRNFADPVRGMAECYRLLAPGGRLVVVDFFRREDAAPLRLYLDHMLPLVGRIVSGSGAAYAYLRESKRGFWTPEEAARQFLDRGFREVLTKPLTFGIAHCVLGVKPAGR